MEESFTAASIHHPAVHPPTVDPASFHPPAVDPAAAHPSAVDPASFHPPAVDPASFQAPAVDPAGANPSAVDPASFHPPAVDPAGANPSAVDPASFHPPAVDPAGANPCRYPSWVLLDSRAYFADRVNATTVKATTSAGHEFVVTFCLTDPPAVSYFCVHFPAISILECCTTEPRVVSSANDFALLCFPFRTGTSSTDEYFVYRAASGSKPTIRSVPCPPPTYRHSWHAAIVPGEDDNFLVADLSPNEDLGHYNLHIFSSETGEWITKHVQLKILYL